MTLMDSEKLSANLVPLAFFICLGLLTILILD